MLSSNFQGPLKQLLQAHTKELARESGGSKTVVNDQHTPLSLKNL